jgi:hypothetical protein
MEEQETSRTAIYITIEKACRLLRMKEEEVKALYTQGRLDAAMHEGEWRYSLASVLLQRVETLMRRSPAEAKTREAMEELASLQFQRGKLRATDEVGAALEALKEVKEQLHEMNEEKRKFLAEIRAMDEGLLRRLQSKGTDDEEREGRREDARG